MDLKNQLTKTPYLVLFMVLISVGVGTASALVTITLAGDVIITGNTDVHGDLDLSGNSNSDFDRIFFDDSTEFLTWDDIQDRFEFSEGLATKGPINTGSIVDKSPYNRMGFDSSSHGLVGPGDLFLSGNLEVDRKLYAEDGIFLGTLFGGDDDFIYFDSGSDEFLAWDDSETRFVFSDELILDGPIRTGTINQGPVGYNVMGNAFTSTADISSTSDLLVSDSLEVGDDLYLGLAEGDRDIKFYEDGVPDGERFQWDDSADAFEVSDDFTVFGKLTVTGLIDPPAITFSAETHDSIKQLAIGVSDHEEVMQFWNGDNNRFEVYVILQDAFYTLDGKEVKYKSTGIPENSAVNRLAEFEEQEKARLANPEVEESDPEIEE